mgnify:CR=1 FL=1
MNIILDVTQQIENIVDRSRWVKFKVSDLVENIVEKVTPKSSGLKHYIGLEHLDSGSLRIRRFGDTTSLVGDKLKIHKGDLIFAKRNAYLKRVAIAEFDAVASAHSMVLRSKPENVLPEFLPFFLLSEKFWERAIEISVGSLSPTINWKALAKQEFLLPPKDQQAQLAELIWAINEVIEKDIVSKDKNTKLKNTIFKNTIFSLSNSADKYFGKCKSNYPVHKLGELIVDLQYGISESLSEDQGVPVLRMNNLQNGKLDLSDLKYFENRDGCLDKFILQKGDVLFNRTNSFDLVGKVSLFDEEDVYSFASYLLRINTDKDLLAPSFLNFYLNSPIGLSKIRRYRTPGVSQSNINAQNLKYIPVPTPPIKVQDELMNKIVGLEDAESSFEERIRSSRSLQKSLINQVF